MISNQKEAISDQKSKELAPVLVAEYKRISDIRSRTAGSREVTRDLWRETRGRPLQDAAGAGPIPSTQAGFYMVV